MIVLKSLCQSALFFEIQQGLQEMVVEWASECLILTIKSGDDATLYNSLGRDLNFKLPETTSLVINVKLTFEIRV